MPLGYEGPGFGSMGNDVTDAAGLLQGLRATDDAFTSQPGLLGGLSNVFEDEQDFGDEEEKEPKAELRCSRQNGLGWQCASPAVENRRYCEKHLIRKPKKKRPKVVPVEVVQDGDPNARPRAGMCRRTNGQGWWCKRPSMPGTTFCQNHLDRIRKQRKTRAERVSGKSPPPAPETSSQQDSGLPSKGDEEKFGVKEEQFGVREEASSDEDKPLWELPGLRSGGVSLMQIAEGGGAESEDRTEGDWRCKRRDGRNWRCSKERQMGRPYCREHTELDRKKREAAKKVVKDKKRQKKEEQEAEEQRDKEASAAQSSEGGGATLELFMPQGGGALQQRQGVESVMSAAELFMPQGGGYPEQLIRFAPAGLQAAGMPLPNRSAFTPVASHPSHASHGSAFTPVASHSFGGHAFVPVNRGNNNNKNLPQQSGFGQYGEGSFGAGNLAAMLSGTGALGASSYRDESVHNPYTLSQVLPRTCQLGDGKGWTCALRAVEGQSFCEKHCEQLRKSAAVPLTQEDLAQQMLAEHQERERRAYAMMEDVQQELLMYGSDAPRFGSILSI